MRVAIMQPYFFPYIGYFQLMNSVDLFVVFDNVQYIDRGWVNRNRISIDNKVKWLTFPVKKGARELAINERHYLLNQVETMKAKIGAAYSRSKFFSVHFPLVSGLLDFADSNVATFNYNLLCRLARNLGIRCNFLFASEIPEAEGLRGEDRILQICRETGATEYVNSIGGAGLYDPERFAQRGLDLRFVVSGCEQDLIDGRHVYLSVIHELMIRGTEGVLNRLRRYELVRPEMSS